MNDACIEHTQKGNGKGYGHTNIKGKSVYLHRLAFAQAHGVPLSELEGKVIRHKCDNPRCINPNHLETGTYVDNYWDMVNRGRHSYKLSAEQVAEIRERHSAGGITQRFLAREYGVTPTQICYIVNNKQRTKS